MSLYRIEIVETIKKSTDSEQKLMKTGVIVQRRNGNKKKEIHTVDSFMYRGNDRVRNQLLRE